MKPEAKEILPRKVLAEVACAIPDYVHPNIVIIGSLAAGYWLFQSNQSFGVRTKDIDAETASWPALWAGPIDGRFHLFRSVAHAIKSNRFYRIAVLPQ